MTGRRHTNTPSARKFIIAQKHPALQAVSGKFCIFYKQFTSLPEDRSSPGACLRFDVRPVSPSAHPRTSTSAPAHPHASTSAPAHPHASTSAPAHPRTSTSAPAHPRTSTSSGSLLFKEKQRTTFPFSGGCRRSFGKPAGSFHPRWFPGERSGRIRQVISQRPCRRHNRVPYAGEGGTFPVCRIPHLLSQYCDSRRSTPPIIVHPLDNAACA